MEKLLLLTTREKFIINQGSNMVPIRNKDMVFEDYFFNQKKMKVVSIKRDVIIEIKPLKDRSQVAWRLCKNGQYYVVTLREIIEYTLQIRPNHNFYPH